MKIILLIFLFFTIPLAAEKDKHVPDPMNLKSSWWDYLKTDGPTLEKRSATFQESLKDLRSSLDEKEHADLIHKIDKTILNLNMLVEKKADPEELKPVKLLLLEKYEIEQLLQVVKNLNRIQYKITDQKDDLARQRKLLAQHRSELDEHYLLYSTLSKGSPSRLEAGIDIIFGRIDLALIEYQIKDLENRITFLANEEKRLKEELEWAKSKITFENMTVDNLQKKIKQADTELEQAKNQLLKVEKSGFTTRKTDPENVVLKRLWEQKAVYQIIFLEAAKVHVMNQNIKYHLFLVATNELQNSTAELQTMIKEWNTELEDIRLHISLWEDTINNELGRIGKEVAQISNDSEIGKHKQMEIALNLHLEIDRAMLILQELKAKMEDSALLIKLVEDHLIKERTFFETWTILFESYFSKMVIGLKDVANTKIFPVKEQPITALHIFQALLIFLVALVLSKMIRRAILSHKKLGKKLNSSDQFIISKAIHYLLVILGLFAALAFIGLDFTNFVIVASALGVGIGFGLQSIVNNVISGFMILFQRNLKIGDIIEMEPNLLGRVAEVNLQNTRIHSFEGIDFVVPNSSLTTQRVINWTLHDHCRRFRIPFGVAYGTDIDLVEKKVVEATKEISCTVHSDVRYPNPQVWLSAFGDSAIEFELVVWVNLLVAMPHGTAKSTYLWMLDSVLKENGISIPFPQMDLNVKQIPKDKNASH